MKDPMLDPFSLKLVLVGDPPEGVKYQLLQVFSAEKNPPPAFKNYRMIHHMGEQSVKLNLWDIVEPQTEESLSFNCLQTRGFIIVVDYRSMKSLITVELWHSNLAKINKMLKAPVILLSLRGTTTDEEAFKKSDLDERCAEFNFNAYIECSLGDPDSVKKAFDTAIVETLYNNPVIRDKRPLAKACYPHISKAESDKFNIFVRSALELVKSAYPRDEKNRGQCYRLPTDVLKLLLGWVAIAEGCRQNPTEIINTLVTMVRNRQNSAEGKLVWNNGLTLFSRRYLLEERNVAQRVLPANPMANVIPEMAPVADPAVDPQRRGLGKNGACAIL